MFDTICAISTAVSNGAIAIIRISGEDAIEKIDKIFSKDLTEAESHSIHYGYIKDNDEVVDEVLISIFKAPKTYTCEDIVEINSHGGNFVVRKILALVLSLGIRLAEAGEFTKRAYLNGRINLSQAESINDLINAKTNIQASSAIKALKGSVSKIIDPLIDDLLKCIGIIEVNIDYPEYDDVEIMTEEKIKPFLYDFKKRIEKLIDEAQRYKTLKQGIKVAICGKPNVGKSSLLNALLQEDKAIVTNVAGTTRDLVEGFVQLENISLHLIDTAGIRKSDDLVENIGIDRSLKAIEEADFVLFVIDDTYDETDEKLYEMIKEKRHVIVGNKKDLKVNDKAFLSISAAQNDIKDLIAYFNRLYEEDQNLLDHDILNSDRQIALMKSAFIEIDEAIKGLELDVELDLIVDNLRISYQRLQEILGKYHQDDLLDHLFKNFCLGK